MTNPDAPNGRDVRRGDVFIGNQAVEGGRLRKERPLLVVQNDRGNRYSAETIVVAIRDASMAKHLPVLVPVPRGHGGLHKDSCVDAGQIMTFRKDALQRRLGTLPPEVMVLVDAALRISLGL